MPETPWPAEVVKAHYARQPAAGGIDGYLHFVVPPHGRQAIPVTEGDDQAATSATGRNVWKIALDGDRATVSPSIHFIDHFHSPNPVSFELVEELGADA